MLGPVAAVVGLRAGVGSELDGVDDPGSLLGRVGASSSSGSGAPEQPRQAMMGNSRYVSRFTND
jgi:hypothetical protein